MGGNTCLCLSGVCHLHSSSHSETRPDKNLSCPPKGHRLSETPMIRRRIRPRDQDKTRLWWQRSQVQLLQTSSRLGIVTSCRNSPTSSFRWFNSNKFITTPPETRDLSVREGRGRLRAKAGQHHGQRPLSSRGRCCSAHCGHIFLTSLSTLEVSFDSCYKYFFKIKDVCPKQEQGVIIFTAVTVPRFSTYVNPRCTYSLWPQGGGVAFFISQWQIFPVFVAHLSCCLLWKCAASTRHAASLRRRLSKPQTNNQSIKQTNNNDPLKLF